MTTGTGTVRGRLDGISLSPVQVALVLGIVAAVMAVALFMQEPAVHDSLHNFRHVSGITCH